jgi:hypothetical protein
MICGLYKNIDEHFADLTEKFKKDEEEIRNNLDLEIKKQMRNKLKELNFSVTDIYQEDFLYEMGQLVTNLSFERFPNFPIIYNRNREFLNKQLGKPISENDTYSYEGFFNKIAILNTDISLRKDEYIVGIYGIIEIYEQSTCENFKITNLELNVITNYLNLYKILNQYDFSYDNKDKKFNEIYQLKNINKNNMKLHDAQIDIITSIFHRVEIKCTKTISNELRTSSLYTSYDKEVFEIIESDIEKKKKNMEIETYPMHTLPKECITKNQNKLKCCQKCNQEERISITQLFNAKESQFNHKFADKYRISANTITKIETHNVISHSENIYWKFNKIFNDFWVDYIHPVSTTKNKDTVVELLEKKEKKNIELIKENKNNKLKIKKLESTLENYIQCQELESDQQKLLKSQKLEISKLKEEIKKINWDKNELETKHNFLKEKISSMIN